MSEKVNLSFLEGGKIKLKGKVNEIIKFIENFQLKDINLWKKFTNVFEEYEDIKDYGWRGEYWGKMMRGACLVYNYSKNKKLYNILEKTVKELLSKQDNFGRISSYDIEHEFNGWDLWSRKYVITGLLHFVDICKSNNLKKYIIKALQRHVDYILNKIGEKNNQKKIELTSTSWGGVNSCTILEPILDLYKRTYNKKYLKFAEYILQTGGSSLGNILKIAYENKLIPCEYPVQKAYELMSFFEGVLAYYEITKKEYYLKAVLNFVEAVNNTEITIIGCAGLFGECFNYATNKQTEIVKYPTQETCVTVTWMRLLARLYKNLGNFDYIDRIELSVLNAFYGSININKLLSNSKSNEVTERLPFDSYSPLNNDSRNLAIGGLKDLNKGGHYGCCACIGSAGVTIIPITSVIKNNKGYIINYYNKLNFKDDNFAFLIKGDYINNKEVEFIIKKSCNYPIELTFRIPNWCKNFKIIESIGNSNFEYNKKSITINKIWKQGEKIKIKIDFDLTSTEINGYKMFKFGPFVLARDNLKEKNVNKINEVDFNFNDNNIIIEKLLPKIREMIRFKIKNNHGNKYFILTDYASCGKKWNKNNKISVWLKHNKNNLSR